MTHFLGGKKANKHLNIMQVAYISDILYNDFFFKITPSTIGGERGDIETVLEDVN